MNVNEHEWGQNYEPRSLTFMIFLFSKIWARFTNWTELNVNERRSRSFFSISGLDLVNQRGMIAWRTEYTESSLREEHRGTFFTSLCLDLTVGTIICIHARLRKLRFCSMFSYIHTPILNQWEKNQFGYLCVCVHKKPMLFVHKTNDRFLFQMTVYQPWGSLKKTKAQISMWPVFFKIYNTVCIAWGYFLFDS